MPKSLFIRLTLLAGDEIRVRGATRPSPGGGDDASPPAFHFLVRQGERAARGSLAETAGEDWAATIPAGGAPWTVGESADVSGVEVRVRDVTGAEDPVGFEISTWTQTLTLEQG